VIAALVDFDPLLMLGLALGVIGFPLCIFLLALADYVVERPFADRDRQRRLLDLHLYALKLKEQGVSNGR